MFDFIANFCADEEGAATVEYVILAAAIAGLGVTLLASVRTGARTMGSGAQGQLSTSVSQVRL
jgi:Flp pilus assembly pilin Flp